MKTLICIAILALACVVSARQTNSSTFLGYGDFCKHEPACYTKVKALTAVSTDVETTYQHTILNETFVIYVNNSYDSGKTGCSSANSIDTSTFMYNVSYDVCDEYRCWAIAIVKSDFPIDDLGGKGNYGYENFTLNIDVQITFTYPAHNVNTIYGVDLPICIANPRKTDKNPCFYAGSNSKIKAIPLERRVKPPKL